MIRPTVKGRDMDFSRDPFLLPLCPCGGAIRLSHVEPHAVDEQKSLRTYVCQACDSSQTHAVIKRELAMNEPDQRQPTAAPP
jgi:hypothetical protein